jgi:tetratricopeptide (TPR) repeat protein
MTRWHFAKFASAVAACAVVAGCATQDNTAAAVPETFNKNLAAADAVWKGGDNDRAIPLYQQLAKDDPTREEPWSRIAQIQFAQNHYGQAIVAAQEALQRDQTDRQAKSVLVVSGLRVATQSLGELRQDEGLTGDATADAQSLAKQLRDTLGEATLFPEEAAEEQQKAAAAAKKKRRVVHHVAAPVAASASVAASGVAAPAAPASAASPAPAKASGASDPFSALRK